MQNPPAGAKVKLLYNLVLGITALSLIGSITLATLALQNGPSHYLSIGIWLALSALYYSFRYRAFHTWKVFESNDELPMRRAMQLHSLMTGCVWGAASLLFMPALPVACQAAFVVIMLWVSFVGLPFAQDARSVSAQFAATWLPTAYALYISREPLTASVAILCMLGCAYFATVFCNARLTLLINANLAGDESQREEDEENALLRYFIRKAQHDLTQPFYVINAYTSEIRKRVAPHHPELAYPFEGLKEALDEMREIIDTKFDHKKYSMAYLPPTRDENMHSVDA